MGVLDRILRAGDAKKVKLLGEVVTLVNEREPDVIDLSDAELAQRTVEFRKRLAGGETLDDLLPEAFATVREAAKRILGQRHFDVQVMGGAALHYGWIAEMRTGEGKTLTCTLPAYLNGLVGNVHVVTVNDYLAKRDAEWMGGVHRFLGLEVGLIQQSDNPAKRAPEYAADITYGTNNEFGFDYLRDNMAMRPEDRVQRGHHYAIVDEVDSILVDEARTPLIISGRVGDSAQWYKTFARLVPGLTADVDYEVDEAKKIVAVTEEGIAKVEDKLGVDNLYDEVHADLVHHLTVAIKAKELYGLDVDYIVRDGEVLIVDEFTGRILEGRRYSEGLHQAIEAKEGVAVKEENQTLATITLQNYFRLYEKLSGMTGTGKTEEGEFINTYECDVVPIPTHRPMIREDRPDLVYKTEDAKYQAIVDEVAERNGRGQPVLIGTVSIEKNERLSRELSKRGVKHQVLNAKNHFKEGAIIAQAGRLGAVTVATNMAGRGVDIILGGSAEAIALEEMQNREIALEDDPELFQKLREEKERECAQQREIVLEQGGLLVIGTERHESRRIDNQLRGRSGRQGDPGESQFFLSLEDDLMRLFGGDAISGLMDRLKIPDDVPIESKMVSKRIEGAQHRVEERNFEIRKNVLQYDEVMNKQREVVYTLRNQILDGADMHERTMDTIAQVVEGHVRNVCAAEYPEEWDLGELVNVVEDLYPTTHGEDDVRAHFDDGVDAVVEMFADEAQGQYEDRLAELGPDLLGKLERQVTLSILDTKWREHLYEMDYLQEGINLRAFAQTDPLTAFQREGYDMFGEMLGSVDEEITKYMFRINVVRDDAPQARQVQEQKEAVAAPAAVEASSGGAPQKAARQPARSDKVGRNEPCPCGSGKKAKNCHPEYTT
ncbi:MAG: preprotein translocase subunit SecA [Acidimicrobiia bacterium]|nr:preprotein translocase subunit SecA [Acidimicrobiia bacterium]